MYVKYVVMPPRKYQLWKKKYPSYDIARSIENTAFDTILCQVFMQNFHLPRYSTNSSFIIAYQ